MPSYLKYTIIFVLAAALFLPFLGHVHLFDWDEINFAECAREMIASGDYLRPQIDYLPFWEKPPLFIWMQVLSMKLFGVGEYAARFPNAVMGITTLLTLFYVGKRVAGEKIASWWVLLYAASWLPHFYFKSGIIDPSFNFFIFVAFFQFHLLRFSSRKLMHASLAGLFLGLAVMTKGPVAILIALLCLALYILVNKGLWGYKAGHLFIIVLAAAIPFAGWIAAAAMTYGWDYASWFLSEFISYQVKLLTTEDAGHGGFFLYHFVVLLLGCFPASVFLFQYSRSRVTENERARDFTRLMWILFWVVLILFTIVKTKIVHYSSLCYFPLSYLAALQVSFLSEGTAAFRKITAGLLLGLGIVFSVIFIALPVVGLNIDKIAAAVSDPNARANMEVSVSWHWAETLWGFIYLSVIVFAWRLMRSDFRRGLIVLCTGQILLAQILIFHFTPKIEMYSQNAAIEYYKSFRGREVYVYTLGYHSYGNLFYAQKPATVAGVKDKYAMSENHKDKAAYFICKIDRANEYSQYPWLKETGRKGGFVFFQRIEP